MSIKTQLFIAKYWIGRIYLHILCFFKDRNFICHLKGILREFN